MGSEEKLGRALAVAWVPVVPYMIGTVDPTAAMLKRLPEEVRSRYAREPWLEWTESIDRLCNPLPTDMRGMLDSFLRLSRGSSDDVEEFVFRWGSLEFCQHLLPSHCEPITESNPGLMPIRWEPTRCYRDYSSHYHALLELGANLTNMGNGTDDQWEAVLRFVPDEAIYFVFSDDWGIFNSIFDEPINRKLVLQRMRETGMEAFALGQLISWELQQDPVILAIESSPNSPGEFKPKLGLVGGTMGVLSYQLAVLIQGALFAVCSNCHDAYAPRRKPQMGRDNYCDACSEVRKTAYKARKITGS